ncbi:response regulator transcription factor [Mogibacterium neglectum]|uniref:response regulator transcription factor n=1 Tax=Mogibacterium neglectum TaxID=114528 RepID=UPI00272B6042|nr:response regulator transcription factor [Mogibacterium neglectum]WLD76520.1 response regulator transcription factor [Mogibacterium neglectum]
MATILFLEDEDMIREVLSEYMMVAGHEVIPCERGDEAIKIVEEGKEFDLAVLDIRVPGVTGLEVLQIIKNKRSEDTGTIMLTAYDDINTQLEAFNYLADDYITKPASPIILIKRIEAVLRRTGKRADSEMDNGFVVDEDELRAYYNKKNLKLTVSEFVLMKTLRDSTGRVFSRDQLINMIFDEEYVANDRIIDAHIKNLRKKLPHDYIETVIGVGYRWRKEDEIKK